MRQLLVSILQNHTVIDSISGWIIRWLTDPRSVFFVLLTAALVGLYYKQASIQERQTDILDTQKDVMRASNNPVIDVDFISPITKDVHGNVTETQINIGLINVGEGAAIYPGIYTGINVESEEFEFKESATSLVRTKEKMPSKDIHDKSGILGDLSVSIPADNQVRYYRTPVRMAYRKNGGEYTDDFIHNVLADLYDSGIDEIGFHMGVTVRDIVGEHHDYELLDVELDLEEVKNSQSMLQFAANKDHASDFEFSKVFMSGIYSNTELVTEGGPGKSEWTNKFGLLAVRTLSYGVAFGMEDLEQSQDQSHGE